jgi:hypothetical protein
MAEPAIPTPLSQHLTSLNPREAVTDALYRCLLGIDSNDRGMFESACLKDESMSVVAGPINLESWNVVNDFFQRLFTLITTHITSNIRIEMKDGEDTASLTAHAIAYHVRPDDAYKEEDTSYTAWNLYSIDLVKDGSLWKIKEWEIKTLRTTGDRAVIYP